MSAMSTILVGVPVLTTTGEAECSTVMQDEIHAYTVRYLLVQ